jgi:membrane protease YdiL (CAAX protease family)
MKTILNVPYKIWATVLKALLFPLCCALMLIVIWPVSQMLPPYYRDVFTGAMAALGAFLLSFLFLKWEKIKKERIGIIPGRYTFPRVLSGFSIGLLLVAAHTALLYSTGHISFTQQANMGTGIILYNLFLYLAFALREEIAYRGFPLRSLALRIAPWKAQLIMAVAFAIEHKVGGYTWLQAFTGAALGGILFGVAALKTKGLAFPLGIHAAWNFGQWIMGGKNTAGVYKLVIEKGYEDKMQMAGNIFFWLVIGLAIITLSLKVPGSSKGLKVQEV